MRELKSWTQEDLGDVLGMDRREIVRIEAGQKAATLHLIEELAQAFEVTYFEFLEAMANQPGYLMTSASSPSTFEEFENETDRIILVSYPSAVKRDEVVALVKDAVQLPRHKVDVLSLIAMAFKHEENLMAQLMPEGKSLMHGKYIESEQEKVALKEQSLAKALERSGKKRSRAPTVKPMKPKPSPKRSKDGKATTNPR